jgi:hypothetical protein
MEQLAVVRFVVLKKLSVKVITTELEDLYKQKALSLSAVKSWHAPFANARISPSDQSKIEKLPQSDLCESRTFAQRKCSKILFR